MAVTDSPILAEVVRSGFTESRHRGAVVVLGPGGAVTQAVLRLGGAAERVYMNCSGKHAAMLATCVQAGWPTSSYLEPGHPLQPGIRATLEDLASERVAAVGVDGWPTRSRTVPAAPGRR